MFEDDTLDDDQVGFTCIESYFGTTPLQKAVRMQLESFNFFIDVMMPRTIAMFQNNVICSDNDFYAPMGKHLLEVHTHFTNPRIHPPYIHENNGSAKIMFPQEARIRNFDYLSNVSADLCIQYVIRNRQSPLEEPTRLQKTIPNVMLFRIPIMVRSDICMLTQNKHLPPTTTQECARDPGGYFILKGSEKVVIGQERAKENHVNVFFCKRRQSWYADVRSIGDNRFVSPKCTEMLLHSDDHSIQVTLPRLKQPIELAILFRALGVLSDRAWCNHILLDTDRETNPLILECLQACATRARHITTQEEALDKLATLISYVPTRIDGKTRVDLVRDILLSELFPHCKTLVQKRFMLGYMARKLLLVYSGILPPEDRDSYLNKRIDLTGVLLNNLFRNVFHKMIKMQNKKILVEIEKGGWRATLDYMNIVNESNLYRIIRPFIVTNGLKNALATGDFSVKQHSNTKVGVAQVLNRLNNVSALSQLRRVNTPLEKNGEVIEPRKMHNTIWGFLCPPETPEGHSVGTVKNLAILAHVTIPSTGNQDGILALLLPSIDPLESFDDPRLLYGRVKVLLNGCWIGVCRADPLHCFRQWKQYKQTGMINVYTAISFDFQRLEIRLCTDGGRLTRPVFRVDPDTHRVPLTSAMVQQMQTGQLSWNDLMLSIIEYIDPEEQNHSMIAMKNTQDLTSTAYTHCELHPSVILGILASCIPFPEDNQSPRNTYQCAMGKQAIGIHALNFDKRFDRTSYVQAYLSHPLVETRYMRMLGLHRMPCGYMVHVAIMINTGFNQEDSLLMNEGSIRRGLFASTIFHTEKDEDKNAPRDEIIRCNPDPAKTRGIKLHNYSKLQPDGFMPENTLIESRDIIMGKAVPIKENRNDPTQRFKFEDQSKMLQTNEETYIDKNFVGRNNDGNPFAKVRTRAFRQVSLGDKFSSRHGQKGTCGLCVPEKDMPYTQHGQRPDIIINPHAIPSRMTVAQLKETLLGKVLLELGVLGDGTSFGTLTIKTICERLSSRGMESCGNELMYNGYTGEQMECSIFMGPVFYQRLKHMVNDKMHARSFGPNMNLTRQPTEGRSRNGGLR
jgi:DNA-directed RNA polymerase II subunit RPB2